jgi:hypothetical protein
MPQDQINDLWKVTNGIRSDVNEIKICLARLDERSAARESQFAVHSHRLDQMESKLQKLDLKVAAAMGMVALISYGLQLLVPSI